jgi:hypothetical protein
MIHLFSMRVAVAIALVAISGSGYGQSEKKLISVGWDMKSPEELAKGIDQLQRLPFDGLTIRTNWCYTFYSTGLGSPDGTVELVKNIKWGKFTDNFIWMVAGKKVDWFDDKLWADDGNIMKNIRALAKIGAAAGCKGIVFDPELIYWGAGDNTWDYTKQLRRSDKTFAEFEVMTRKRGVQVMKAINQYMPNTNFLVLFWGSMANFREAAKANDPKLYQEIVQGNNYGLVNAFLCGMLEGADSGTYIIDGDESSYYNTSAKAYQNARAQVKEKSLAIIPKDLQAKYRQQVQYGSSVFADYLSNGQIWQIPSTYLTPAERAKWMEHNVYWAMKTSDHYVWMWSEHIEYLRNKLVAPEMIPAINLAKEKVNTGQPLGFEIKEMLTRASQEISRSQTRPLVVKTAKIPRLGQGQAAPTIDGKLDDPAWKEAAVLGPFITHATAKRKELYAATEAKMIFDSNALYIAFECKDPNMKNVVTSPFEDNMMFWTGDAIELEIAATPENKAYYHIKIGANNTRWDSLTKAGYDIYGKDSYWTGTYKSAVHKGSDAWTVEIAIPWSDLKMTAPKTGDKIKGSLERRTHGWNDGVMEVSSWSEKRTLRCPEAENFGTWIFE